MPIDWTCACGRKLRVADHFAGMQGRCPACGGLLQIPGRDATESAHTQATAPTDDADLAKIFGEGFAESLATPAAQPAPDHQVRAESEEMRPTAVGCVLTLLSTAVIFIAAVPIVRWRDPATGQPLPRFIAILSPILVGAAVNGIGMLLLKLVGVRVWVKKEK